MVFRGPMLWMTNRRYRELGRLIVDVNLALKERLDKVKRGKYRPMADDGVVLSRLSEVRVPGWAPDYLRSAFTNLVEAELADYALMRRHVEALDRARQQGTVVQFVEANPAPEFDTSRKVEAIERWNSACARATAEFEG